ncbi:MAG TPA: thioesterase family protein [Ornithinibacter sp.]|jgi:acyl-CoA thioesterase|nr:thioesterase family protein [Ornithinibacter sp.]HOB79124.1 thioesterase family protein [Ornithinibacter sp.]HPV89054.1 thioesterase family protein [Ornithinibacter sp.]HQA12950.1 thioesterase family protein [Ornithinibacter sp.]HQD67207.1 thioesterase family protein [Ornithinibacter sp.]
MPEFDEATAVRWDAVVPAVAGATGVAHGHLDEGWAIGHAINGGVLMATATSAASEVLSSVGHPDVLTWGAHFLSAARPGPLQVDLEVLRVGRGASTATVRLRQPEDDGLVERVHVTGTFGTLDRAEPVHRAPAPPSMPDPDSCVPALRDSSPVATAIVMLDRLDVRVDPATIGFAVGRPSQRGVIRAWLRMADGREPDAALLPYVVDAFMPVSFDLGVPGWAPTMELTGHVLGRPAPGWLLAELTTDTVVGDLLIEDAAVWDSAGRLVARSRQLAGVRVPAN